MVIAAVGGRAMWYLTRGTGVVSLLLLSLTLLLGVTELVRWATARWPRMVTSALHRNVSLLAVAFLAVHIGTSVIDGFAPIGWLDAVIPFHSAYRPIWLGLGALAFDLLIALVVTSLLRRRIGPRVWRIVHWTAYACWPVAVVHGLGTGTDTQRGWALAVALACLAVVVIAVWWRLSATWPSDPARRAVPGMAFGASVLVPLAIMAWLVSGPLQHGWSRRAGTPTRLLGTAVAAAAAPAAPPAAAPAGSGSTDPFPAVFSAQLQGRLAQSGPDGAGNATVTIDGTLSGPVTGLLHIVLSGPAAPGGGISLATSAASLGPAAQPNQFQGSVTGLSGTRLALSLTGPAARQLTLNVRLQVDQASGTVSGIVQAGGRGGLRGGDDGGGGGNG